jgi:hypothetical protein
MRTSAFCLIASTSMLLTATVSGQNLPPPSRTVYKCDSGGKVVYSDSPCIGAQRVDVEPTRGMNKSSGTERVGADVRTERTNEAVANALRLVFNESAEQRAKRHRRAKLPPASQTQCRKLDDDIANAEAREKAAPQSERAEVQKGLYALRLQHSQLKC